MPITQCNFHPLTFYLPFHTSPPVDQCPVYAPSNCTMGLNMCARHPLFGCTDPYYTVIFYSSCGLNKSSAATIAFPLSVSILSSFNGALSGSFSLAAHTHTHIYIYILSAPCGCKLGNFSVAGVLSNIRITAPPNDCRSRCYVPQQEMANRWQLRVPSIYLLVLLKQ